GRARRTAARRCVPALVDEAVAVVVLAVAHLVARRRDGRARRIAHGRQRLVCLAAEDTRALALADAVVQAFAADLERLVVLAVAHLGTVGRAGVLAAVVHAPVQVDEARLAVLHHARAGAAAGHGVGQLAPVGARAAPARIVLQIEVLVGAAIAVVVDAVAR